MYTGGYHVINESLLKTGVHKHTKEIEQPIPDNQLLAINCLQATPWRINRRLMDVMKEAFQSGSSLGKLPTTDDIPLPPRLDDAVWQAMTKEQRGASKLEREKIHNRNAAMIGRREGLVRKLKIAEEMKDHTLWFPHAVDWRGRAYAIPQDLNPQSDDCGKALLMFDEAKPLGKSGPEHLMLRLASSFGMDKVGFDDRIAWVEANKNLIIDSADDPLDGERFWSTAEEPWQFLAAAFEFAGLHREGEGYECGLPMPVDATCSGLQHLSAMGLSLDGGRRVNLTSEPRRFDVYTIVAEAVARKVEEDAAAGVEEAKNWLGKVTRKTVKRQVMTLCYGATSAGMSAMVIEDGHANDLEGQLSSNAKYLTKALLAALGDVLDEAYKIMRWVQTCADRIAKANQPMDFVNPIGMRVRQAYRKLEAKRISTLVGQVSLQVSKGTQPIDAYRSKLGSVPNVIHSFDASHLYLTILRTTQVLGRNPAWAMVHDSFGTHAGEDTVVLNRSIRESFVEIYSEDWLGRLHADFSAKADVPPPPKRGSLDIFEVIRSPYFFS